MNYKQVKPQGSTYDDTLDELISYRVSKKEKLECEAVARENDISIGELMRNVQRDYLHEFALSQDLKSFLEITNKIDQITVKNRVMASRKTTLLHKVREFMYDFEDFLEQNPLNISDSELRSKKNDFDEMIKSTFKADEFVYNKISAQIKRILKKKVLKRLDC